MPSRIITRIELTPQAKNRINEMSRTTGMTQVAILSRLVEWFSGQSGIIQAWVLGRYPEAILPDVARLILSRLPPSQKPFVSPR